MHEVQDGETVVLLDLRLGPKDLGRIKIKLFAADVPKTSENFRQFCTGEYRGEDGKPIGYKNSGFHRIVKDFMVQGGDFLKGNGLGSFSIYGSESFADENFIHQNKRMSVAMANSGPDTNGCQFFINVADNDFLDGKHVVFGEVVEGQDIVDQLSNVRTNENDRPTPLDVVISNCGEM
ncbi:DEKNAAC100878 [Brettanomyces naardenensis]|uniref:Peptidyl-prolyl cis-trans isomerase n=1 Tax=Brettanomyces naardenensis TaxID=13370 RepID=A0A448YF96_BRENA|nr:DEKNAAC100878 [Brettanomyces naardenensis]